MKIHWDNQSWLTSAEIKKAKLYNESIDLEKLDFNNTSKIESWVIYKTKLGLFIKKIWAVMYLYKENGDYDSFKSIKAFWSQ